MGYSQAATGGRKDILILPGPNALASRLWHQILDAADEVGIDHNLVEVVQGSYNPGGVAASGQTHARGGTYDLRLRGISDEKAEEWCVALRKRGACAFPRIPKYGWDQGRHIHAVDRFEPDLSVSARWQVGQYDAGLNALSGGSSAPDPLPHPKQTKYEYNPPEEDMALTADDLAKLAEAVWTSKVTDPQTKEVITQRELASRTLTVARQARDAAKEAAAKPDTVVAEHTHEVGPALP